jgi:sugar lactone lactonase YvrE
LKTSATIRILVSFLLSLASSVPLPGQVIRSIVGTNTVFPLSEIPAKGAPFGSLIGIVKDTNGNTYVSDQTLNMVFRISGDGKVSIVAGNGLPGYSGDGGPANLASLTAPSGLAVDSAGAIYIADTANHRVRRVNPDGTIVTAAGTGTSGNGLDNIPAVLSPLNGPSGVAIDPNGTVYFTDTNNHRIRAINSAGIVRTIAGSPTAEVLGDGGPASQAMLHFPFGLHRDADGNLYVADASRNSIRKITPDGRISTVVGNGVFGFSGDNVAATATALRFPYQAVTDPGGNLLIADHLNSRVRRVSPQGIITTVAGTGTPGFDGDGGPAAAARISAPGGIFADGILDFAFTDSYNGLIRRVRNGSISTVAGRGIPSLANDSRAAFVELREPNGVAIDAAGDLYICDARNSRILKLSSDGIVRLVAGSGISGYSGDGGQATQANLFFPEKIAVDLKGNLYIADFENNRVRMVTPAGIISTIVGTGTGGWNGDGLGTQVQINHPRGLTSDPSGNLYFVDYGNGRVRKLGTDGRVQTIAGTGTACQPALPTCYANGIPATNAVLPSLTSLTTDGKGT